MLIVAGPDKQARQSFSQPEKDLASNNQQRQLCSQAWSQVSS